MLPEIIRRKPDLFEDFQKSMNRWAKDFFDEKSPDSFVPKLSVEESDKKVTLTAELPGLNDKDVEIEMDEDSLTLKGEKKSEIERKNGDRYYSECSYGSFERTVRLPEGIDRNKVEAKFENGILRVELPKIPGAAKEVKKIAIKH